MPVIFIFAMDNEPLLLPEVSSSLTGCLGVPCFAYRDERKLSAAELTDGGVMSEGQIWVELPDLDPGDGQPLVSYEVAPRLDREDSLQAMVDEILDQEDTLREVMDRNSIDIMLTFDDTLAGMEAANCLAYVLAAGTGAGLLVPNFEGEEDTLWFDNADDFADAAFGEDDEEE